MFLKGKTLVVECIPAVDQQGQAGLRDKVDHHFLHNLGSLILRTSTNYADQLPYMMGYREGMSMVEPTGHVMEPKAPTFQVRKGYAFNLLVVRDVEIPN